MPNVYGVLLAIAIGGGGLYFRLKLTPIFNEQKVSLHWPSVEGKIIESRIEEKKHRDKRHHSGRSDQLGAIATLIDRRVSHTTYHPIIKYSFVVNGIEYQSDQEMLKKAFNEITGIGTGHIESKRRIEERDIGANGIKVKDGYYTPYGHFRSPEKAQEVADMYPVGKLVKVYYNPDSPQRCFLVKHELVSERWVKMWTKIWTEIIPFILIGVSLIVFVIALTELSL